LLFDFTRTNQTGRVLMFPWGHQDDDSRIGCFGSHNFWWWNWRRALNEWF